VKVGGYASDFNLKNVDGSFYSMKNDKNAKGFIVIFTCNHCPFSQLYEQRIIELDNKYRSQGFPVVAINPNDAKKVPEDSYEEMIKRANELNFPFPYLHDETQQTARQYGAMRTPHVFVLVKDKEKKDAYKVAYIGAVDDDTENVKKDKVKYVEDAVDALLKGKEPKVKETKAIGCSIKWKA
jgi:glutathione peroxidase-family protein